MSQIQIHLETICEPKLKTSDMVRINIAVRGHAKTSDAKRFVNLVHLVVCNASNTRAYIGEHEMSQICNHPKQKAAVASLPRNYYHEVWVDNCGPAMHRTVSTNTAHAIVMSTPGIPQGGPPFNQISFVVPMSHPLYWVDFAQLKNAHKLEIIFNELFDPYGIQAIEPDLGFDQDYQMTYMEL